MPDETKECPNCGQKVEDGYLSTIQNVQVKLTLFKLTVGVRILYSPKCGFLKLLVLR